ncbi:MAG: diadenylate cyclase [Candidatus Omnitrophota bacterium]|nr:diadenylate cyclase [Candidatus Omnitrophota bacterium]
MFKHILEFAHNIRLVDFIDIGVIAIFIYSLLVWLKKAKARFILIGMVILGSIYIFARAFSLYLTTLVFQAFFAIFLITIVIIFQEDLRHLFERIAILGISRKRHWKIPLREEISILSSAIINLSRKKIGALVVIRGRDPLERHIEAGTDLDGLLSGVLLENIFDPNVPSHDGAVIIDGIRIGKFSVHLPLSTNIREIDHLGTRHAAALGITERTDTLCIVVSEERGVISIAEAGRLKQLNNVAELQGALEDFYSKRFPIKGKPPIIDFLTGHFLEKIIALALTVSLWFTFGHRMEIIRRDFTIPIEYRNLSADKIIGEPKSKQISVTLSGTERTFNFLKPEELKLSLDMSGVKDGENRFLISKGLINYPSGLSVVNVEPGEVKLKVYRMIFLDIPIEVSTHGRPSSGVRIIQIKAIPEKTRVLIPSIIPQDEIKITTEPIDLKSITENVTLTPKLVIPPDVRFQDDKHPEIKVVIKVE